MTGRLIVLALTLATGAACAQTYPTKAVRLVVPFLAGGSTDIVGRTVGQKLSEMWGQPVVVGMAISRPSARSRRCSRGRGRGSAASISPSACRAS